MHHSATLSGGAMTADELEVKVGRPGHLPLNIVNTPGLITNNVPEKGVVDQLIKTVLAGSGDADHPLLPIMTGTGTDVDINNLRTNLVRGRAFITVFTHVDHVMHDQVSVKVPHPNELSDLDIHMHAHVILGSIAMFFLQCGPMLKHLHEQHI